MSWTCKRMVETTRLLEGLPDGIYYEIGDEDDLIKFQASGLDQCGVIRRHFGALTWEKKLNEACQWWEYLATTADGVRLRIYADHVGPASCRRVTEKVKVMQDVPVTFERREVEVERVRWICPPENEASGESQPVESGGHRD